jgi:hypothetical protein
VPTNDSERKRLRGVMMRAMLDTSDFRGAVGTHPEGKLAPDDEGALQFAVGEKDDNVIIEFGTPVAWLALPPQLAADLATVLLNRARAVAHRQGKTIRIKII